jgi:hypothetical protein
MGDYLHAAKVGRHSVVELAQSYLKGYASTWWRTVRQEEGKTHGYTWEFFKERIESEFIPKNSNYISRCKLRDLMNTNNDNLRQYVRAYSELMLEIRHMHELDRVCDFVMGLPTWAKHKLEENWPASLTEAIMKVEGFSNVGRGEKSRFKKDSKFPHKKARHEREWNRGQDTSKGGKPKQFQGSSFKPKGNFVKKGASFKGSQPKGDASGKPKGACFNYHLTCFDGLGLGLKLCGFKIEIMYVYYIAMEICILVCINIFSPLYCLCITNMPHHSLTMNFTWITPKPFKTKIFTPFTILFHKTSHELHQNLSK